MSFLRTAQTIQIIVQKKSIKYREWTEFHVLLYFDCENSLTWLLAETWHKLWDFAMQCCNIWRRDTDVIAAFEENLKRLILELKWTDVTTWSGTIFYFVTAISLQARVLKHDSRCLWFVRHNPFLIRQLWKKFSHKLRKYLLPEI